MRRPLVRSLQAILLFSLGGIWLTFAEEKDVVGVFTFERMEI